MSNTTRLLSLTATAALALTAACGALGHIDTSSQTQSGVKAFDPNNPNDQARIHDANWQLSSTRLILADGLPSDSNTVLRPPAGTQYAGVSYDAERSVYLPTGCFDAVAEGVALQVGGNSYAAEALPLGGGLQPVCAGLGVVVWFVVPSTVTMQDMLAGWVEYRQGVVPMGQLDSYDTNDGMGYPYHMSFANVIH